MSWLYNLFDWTPKPENMPSSTTAKSTIPEELTERQKIRRQVIAKVKEQMVDVGQWDVPHAVSNGACASRQAERGKITLMELDLYIGGKIYTCRVEGIDEKLDPFLGDAVKQFFKEVDALKGRIADAKAVSQYQAYLSKEC